MSGFGNSFGQSGSGFGQANPFAQTQSQSGSSNRPAVFGQSSSTFNQTQSTPGFGPSQSSGFGQSPTTASGFGQSQSSGFGQSQSSGFGQSQPSGFGSSQSSVFGQFQSSGSGQTQTLGFGQSQSKPFSQSNVFGQPNPGFGQANSTGSAATNVFSSGSPAFGSSTTSNTGTFHTSATQPNLFATASVSPSGFGSIANKESNQSKTFGSGSVFGSQSGTFGRSSVFGSKDSKETSSTSSFPSSFSGSSSSPSGSVFGGSSNKTVFGSHSNSKPSGGGFGISTTASTTSTTAFGAPTSNASGISVFGSKQTGFGGAQSDIGQKNPFGITQKSSSQNVFGGQKKESDSSNLFANVPKNTESRNVFGGTNKESSAFGGKRTTASSAFSSTGPTSSSSLFGSKTTTASPTTIFRSARSSSSGSGSSSTNLFGKKSDLPSTGLVTEESPSSDQRSSLSNTSQTQSTKPISSVFGSSKVFGSGSSSTGGFGFSTANKEKQTTADDETGEIKPFAGSKTSGFGRPGSVKLSGSVFGGGSEKSAAGGFVKIKQEPKTSYEIGGESQDGDPDRGRKRTIKREEDGSSKRGRSLFTSAIAGVASGQTSRSERTDPSPSSSRSGDQGSQSEQEESEARRSASQRLRRLPSVAEDVSSKTAIVCKGVPAKFNRGAILRKHFSKYGSVSKVFTNINKSSATIHFHDHKSAAESKKRGRMLGKGIPAMQIFWSSHSPVAVRSAPVLSTDRDTSPRSRKSSETKQTSKWDDDDISSELSIMAGTQDIQSAISRKGREPRNTSPTPSDKKSRTSSHSPSRASPTPSTSASTSSSVTTDMVSLSSLKSAVAKNVHDMARILDQRDKFIREGRTKQSNLATASAFVGTCMDMCPEKERYDREDKRRLSPYEVVPGTENIPGHNPKGDPYRMVKEYSRSSADQDEPLPHELRPTPVLMRTMAYLLTEIADKGTEGKWMDWYGFLWDRTRGIRKEITQQQLMSREAVELLEKCARFHIYCSERLCEEDMHVFDTKINNENLTKCLQTLKEMYHDLNVKHGVFCPHEAEFRAYIVLMNLNEGDTLREVQTLRPEVRNSVEIKFATKVYSALSSSNYVRFFRLVKHASFLGACIIHRYFTQVRTRALQIMIKAFGGRKAQFTLEDMVRILSFNDVEEASRFCQFYGQSVNDGMVILDRNSFYVPECAFSPQRALNLIESKLMVSIGEIVNGSTLPQIQHPDPQCSFDDNGRFKMSQDVLKYAGGKDRKLFEAPSPEKKQTSLFTATTSQPAATKTTAAVQETKTQDVQPKESKQVQIPNEAVKMIAKELFWEVIDEFVAEISQGYVGAVQLYLEAGKKTVEEIVVIGTASLIRQVCTEVYNEETERRKQEVEKEMSDRRARVSEVICHDIVEEVTGQEAKNLATAQMRDVNAELRKQREDRCTETISDKLVEESLCDIVKEISMEVYRVDVIQRREKLEALEQCMMLHRAGRFLQVWKKEYAKRMKLKRAMLAFPCAPSSQNMDSQLKSLLPDRENDRLVQRKMFVNKQARVSIESPMDIERRSVFMNARYSLMSLYRRLMKEKAWRALDIPAIVGTEMEKIYCRQRNMDCTVQDFEREITWKLVVSLPDSTTDICCFIKKWICSKFERGKVPSHPNMKYKGEVLSLYHSMVENKGRQPLQLGVCVRSIIGTLDKMEVQKVESDRLLLGTCGLVFVLEPDDGSPDFWFQATARLAGILHAKPVYPALPLVIVMVESTNQQVDEKEVIQRLEVDSFQDDGLIEGAHVVYVSTDGGTAAIEAVLPQAADQLAESVEWLASHMPEPPELQRALIKDYVEDLLLQEYFGPVLQNLRQRKKQHALHQPPNTLISLYNCTVEHLAEVASSASLTTHSCPIAEFVWYHPQQDLPPAHWNLTDHLSYLYEEISLLQLPRFKYLNYTSDTWQQVCDDVWAFIKTVVKQNKGKDSVRLVTRIKSLLHKVMADFNDVCYLAEGENRCEPTYVNMPWTDVVDACISYRLACLPVWDTYDTEGPQRELYVYYEEEELADFAPPEGWKEAVLHSDNKDSPTVLETVEKAVERKHELTMIEEENEEEEDDIRQSAHVSTTIENQSGVNHSLRSEYDSLLSSIQAEKKESEKFEKYLEEALMEGGGAYMDNGYFIEPIVSNGHFLDRVEEGQGWCVQTPDVVRNGSRIGGGSDDVAEHRLEEEEDGMEEDPDLTIGGKVNKFQDNLFSLRQDSHLFEERLKYLMNT